MGDNSQFLLEASTYLCRSNAEPQSVSSLLVQSCADATHPKAMPSFLDLPDELLIKVIAWVPYRPRSHGPLALVSRRMHAVMHTAALPGMIAWYQFAPFMRLLGAYRGRPTSNFTRGELAQTWKSIAMHRDWILALRDTTKLPPSVCLASISIIHFIAAATKKFTNHFAEIRGVRGHPVQDPLFFLTRVVQTLPPYTLVFIRYITRTTLNEIHDRHKPFDILKHLKHWSQIFQTHFDHAAKHFALACMLESTCMSLSNYHPFYNLMADEDAYVHRLDADSTKATAAVGILLHRSTIGFAFDSAKAMLGVFALHVRLLEISREGEFLHPLSMEVDGKADIAKRLSLEYARMQAIDGQIDEQFASINSSSCIIESLRLEDVGRALRKISDELSAMRAEDIEKHQDDIYETYKLDCWPR